MSAQLQKTDQPTNTPTHSQFTHSNIEQATGRERMRWTHNVNETIVKCYYEVTDLERDMTMYWKKLRDKFLQKFPELVNLSEQRISDQYRALSEINTLQHKETKTGNRNSIA